MQGNIIFAGGVFFVAKEYTSRALPKKAILDFAGRRQIGNVPVKQGNNNKQPWKEMSSK